MVRSCGLNGIGRTAISPRLFGCTNQSGLSLSSLILMSHRFLANEPVSILNSVRRTFGRPASFLKLAPVKKSHIESTCQLVTR